MCFLHADRGDSLLRCSCVFATEFLIVGNSECSALFDSTVTGKLAVTFLWTDQYCMLYVFSLLLSSFYCLSSTMFAIENVICCVYSTACQWHNMPFAVFSKVEINK